MAQLIFYDADSGKEGGRLSEVPDFLVHFRRCEEYDGGFGFDWLRDEYLYETKDVKRSDYDDTWKEITFPSICTKKEDLKKKYVELYQKQEKPYYIPWLSMFVNHEAKTGNKVELELKVESIDAKWNKAKVKFECPEGIRIIPEIIELTKKDTIKQDAKGKSENKYISTRITLMCDKGHSGCEIVIKTIVDKKNPVETIVGKLNLIETKEYPLHLRIVKLLRQEHLDSDRNFLDDRISSVISYLKNKSLQQAMIVPQVESGYKEIIISEEQWKNEGKLVPPLNNTENTENLEILHVLDHSKHVFSEYKDKYEYELREEECKEYEQYEEYKEVLKSEEYKDYEIIQRTEKCKNGKKAIKIREPYKGIVLILSKINYKIGGVAGMSDFHPSQESCCFITELGLTDRAVYPDKPQKYYPCISHEIGHILGLDHTFENTLINWDSRTKYEEARNKLALYSKQLPLDETTIIEQKKRRDSEIIKCERFAKKKDIANEDMCKKNIKTLTENIKIISNNIIVYKEFIRRYQQIIESYEWFRDNLDDNGCYFFEKGSTDNIMDYYLLIKSKYYIFNTFYHWQWVRIQKDLIRFHS